MCSSDLCRVRLARNVGGYPFVPKLEEKSALDLCEILRQHLLSVELDGETLWVEMKDAPVVLRLMLRERHLISRDMAPVEESTKASPGRAGALGEPWWGVGGRRGARRPGGPHAGRLRAPPLGGRRRALASRPLRPPPPGVRSGGGGRASAPPPPWSRNLRRPLVWCFCATR